MKTVLRSVLVQWEPCNAPATIAMPRLLVILNLVSETVTAPMVMLEPDNNAHWVSVIVL